ncbi:hypothetical protein PSET11_03221 [Arthrobacter ulcerisalmonis]|uniref:DUF4381 domain-containing protein n=1 Tax=Arthrobacter ulcerisalmonis TaxID=2483813 RepID=A0A3P5XY71_9MICC|nr:hypothetical protein [Arthrobacter ulcerisalmonis]VDC33093.1 hypothetical protein PSET11_03221 [Arthrobacter ulcerisalmonis]
MGAEPEFYGPLGYNPWWLWSGMVLMVLCVAWVVGVLVRTRRRPVRPDTMPRPAQTAALVQDYLARIQAVESAAGAGTISQRAAHQELSLLVRGFFRDATGQDATRMTLAELGAQNLPAAAHAITALYPGEFGHEPLPTVTASAAAARAAVQAWN